MEDRALYLEADEDITSAIDKLRQAPPGPVQIVVPKRSTLLQSVINLKLLKKAADDADRDLVLVTTDKVATGLASRLGLAVASAVGAKAVKIEPEPDSSAPLAEEVIEDDTPPPPPIPKPVEPEEQPKPAVQTKGGRGVPVLRRRSVAADEEEAPAAAGVAAAATEIGAATEDGPAEAAAATPDPKPKVKVPNYRRFQRRILVGAILIVLAIGYFTGMYFLTSATVTLYVAASPTQVASDFGVNPSLQQSDPSSGTLAGQTLTATKTLTSTFQASGTQDDGTKAAGNLAIKNCDESTSPVSLPSGTTFTSNGLSFVSTASVTIPPASFSNGGKTCNTTQTGSVAVTAAANGSQYNLGNATFTSSSLDANYTITATQLSGGTSNIVTVVSAGDLTTAQTAALAGDSAAEVKALSKKAASTQMVLGTSLTQTASSATSNPAVGQQATSATLTLQISYSALAVKKTDLETYLKDQEQQQLGTQDQIYDDGLSSASYAADQKTAAGLAQFKITTTAYGGPKIDLAGLAKQLRGARYGDAVDEASQQPGVTKAAISIWPSWATSLPHLKNHLTIKLSVANAK